MPRDEKLVKAAKDAIDKVYIDTSVSPAKTMERLEEIRDYCQGQIDALNLTMQDESEADQNL